jgi:hypothetical protein
MPIQDLSSNKEEINLIKELRAMIGIKIGVDLITVIMEDVELTTEN